MRTEVGGQEQRRRSRERTNGARAACSPALGTRQTRGRRRGALGTSLSIDATPTFVVNGVPVVGAAPESDLRVVIDRARAEAIASGIPPAEHYEKVVLGM